MPSTRQPFFLTAESCASVLYPESILRSIAKLTKEHEPQRQFTGGILSVIVYRGGSSPEYSMKTIQIGKPGRSTADFMLFAAEKLRRLRDRRTVSSGEVASSQSANPDMGQYGGCIVATTSGGAEVYLSFSGAPAVVDEAFTFVIAEKMGLIVPEGYENPLLERARELFNGCALNASPE